MKTERVSYSPIQGGLAMDVVDFPFDYNDTSGMKDQDELFCCVGLVAYRVPEQSTKDRPYWAFAELRFGNCEYVIWITTSFAFLRFIQEFVPIFQAMESAANVEDIRNELCGQIDRRTALDDLRGFANRDT